MKERREGKGSRYWAKKDEKRREEGEWCWASVYMGC